MYSLGGYIFLSVFVALFMTVVVVMFTNMLPKAFKMALEKWPMIALIWNMMISGLISILMGQSSMAGFANILSSCMFVLYWNYIRAGKSLKMPPTVNKIKEKLKVFSESWDGWVDDIGKYNSDDEIRNAKIRNLEEELHKLKTG